MICVDPAKNVKRLAELPLVGPLEFPVFFTLLRFVVGIRLTDIPRWHEILPVSGIAFLFLLNRLASITVVEKLNISHEASRLI